MTRPPATERLFTPSFIALGVAELCYFTAGGVAIFGLPLYVTGPVGGDEAAAGLAFGAFALSALVLRPVAGRLADRYGRRPLLLAGALLAAASLALIGVADDFAVIVALRLLAGVAEAAFFVAGFAALADLAPPARLGEALSYNSLGLYLGVALGPPLGEVLVRTSGFGLAWAGAAALAVAAAGLALLVGETRAGGPSDDGERHLIHRPALPITLGFLASLVAMGGFLAFASLYAVRVGVANASLVLLVYGGVVVVCRLAFARVPDRLPPLALGAAALGTIALGLVLAASWPSPAGLLLGAVVTAVGVSFSTPAFFSAIFATASPSQRGVASGTASAAIDLGLGIGPILLGLVADPFGIRWALAVGAAVALAGAVWTLLLRRRSTVAASPATPATPAE
ncbi:putative MFS family arabinose efflux permease [Agromyces ramosus]|uniref:Putative MFS family arabinose efflux permease n=1 Tax=Agromyces ramosus TaxID=33879 RepID=A0A4Q7MFI0_9MICO|nr:MFS transporter [Agromyces ramosus]RZS66307.1 putative MFS family arabinose efflux permease [Agromyces ramosus]